MPTSIPFSQYSGRERAVLSHLGHNWGMDEETLLTFPRVSEVFTAFTALAARLQNSGDGYERLRAQDLSKLSVFLIDDARTDEPIYHAVCDASRIFRFNQSTRDSGHKPVSSPLVAKSEGNWSWAQNYVAIDPRCLPIEGMTSVLGDAQPNQAKDNQIVTQLIEQLPERCRTRLHIYVSA
jgi:hypothetical protein